MSQQEDSKVQQSHKDIKMVLLGTNYSYKCLIENTILQKTWMKTPSVHIIPHCNLAEQEATSEEELNISHTDQCVFLLVLQDHKISEDEMKMFEHMKKRFGEKMVENTIVVMVSGEKEHSGEPYERADDNLKKVLDECGKRVCVYKRDQDMKESQLMKQLMEIWDNIQKKLHEPSNSATVKEHVYEDPDSMNLIVPTYEGERARPPADIYITVVLVGKNNDNKCLIGNIILGEKQFKSEDCETNIGKIEDQSVLLIKTSNSLKSDPEADSIDEMKPFYTGPRVFLFILQGSEVSQDEDQIFIHLKKRFGDQIVKNTILLVHSEKRSLEKSKAISTIKLRSECKNRVCCYNKDVTKTELVKELMKYTEEIVQKNQALKSARKNDSLKIQPVNFGATNETHPTPNTSGEKQAEVLIHQEYPEAVYQDYSGPVHQDPPPEFLTIVLLGQTGSGKSATGNTILGHRRFESHASSVPVTQMCQKEDGSVCEMKIVVVDTPDFFNTDLKNQEEELRRCKELIQHGPVVYLLVMELGRFTDGEREVLPHLKKEFGEDMTAKTVILFTCKEKLKDKTLNDYINETDEELQKLIQTCHSRCCAFNNNKKSSQQIKELMDIILNIQTDRNITMSMMMNSKQNKAKADRKCRIM